MKSLGVLLGLLALAACADDGPSYAGLEFDVVSAPPVPIRISDLGIDIFEGIAVKVAIELRSRGDNYPKRTPVVLRASDPEVLTVYATEEERSFVLVANRPGSSCVEVLIQRELEDCIPVHVRPDSP